MGGVLAGSLSRNEGSEAGVKLPARVMSQAVRVATQTARCVPQILYGCSELHYEAVGKTNDPRIGGEK